VGTPLVYKFEAVIPFSCVSHYRKIFGSAAVFERGRFSGLLGSFGK
jgi:hypothetical protein